jgi:hypothetical protein
MPNERQYQQCELKKGMTSTTAWIEQRGAKEGCWVTVKEMEGLWRVVKVYEHVLSESMLKEHQQLNRNSLPSVEGVSR